jgi:shikimate kinase
MGSGKSVIGKALAKILNYQFLDLDTYIEKQEQQTISEIFKNKGEIYFRKKEQYYLQEVLLGSNQTIIALGGGTPCYGVNMQTIKENSISIYLKASIVTLAKRLAKEKAQRPLISNIDNEALQEFIGKHLFERNPFYTQAQTTVVVDGKTVEEVVKAIVATLY